MFNSIKMIAVLTIVGLLSGGFLTFAYQMTAPEIESRRLESLRRAIFTVLPEAVDYKELKLGEDIIYQGINKDGEKAGLAFLAEGSGFQGEIKVMVGAEQDLNKLRNIQVMENVETPGLGAKITEGDFQQQFDQIPVNEGIRLSRGPGEKQMSATTVQAITGATISSKAVVDSINQKIRILKKKME